MRAKLLPLGYVKPVATLLSVPRGAGFVFVRAQYLNDGAQAGFV